MGTPKLTRQAQVAGKVETTPGTVETLTAVEATCRVYAGVGIEPAIATEPRDIVRSTLSRLGSLPGEKKGGINFKTEVNTPDTVTNTLEYKPFLEACGLTIQNAKRSTLGQVYGEFQRGETVEDESEATARVLMDVSDSGGYLYHLPISGTLGAEKITGGTSGATSTASDTPTTRGHLVYPTSNNQKPISAAYYEDGYWWCLTGAMGNLAETLESSKAGFFDFSLTGPKSDFGDKNMLEDITYQTEAPPVLQGANLTINDVNVVALAINIDLGNTVIDRTDLNKATTGIIADYISGRDTKITISFEQLPEATLDIDGLWAAGTEMPIKFQLGTSSGKTIWHFIDNAQITNIGPGDTNGIRTVDVEFSANGDPNNENDEIEWLFI